jgi:thiol-disulfide isomerase/thioredoxin
MSGEDKSEGEGKPGEAGAKTGFIGILAVGLMIGIIIGVAVGAFGFPQAQSQGFSAGEVLAPKEAGNKVTGFISNYSGYFRLPPGVDIALINVTEVENANLYKIAINISAMGESETVSSYMTKDGKLLFLGGGIDIEEFEEMAEQQKKEAENRTREQQQEQQQQQNTTIGNFIVSSDEICLEDGKPIIYFFGRTGCPACEWEYPIVANVTAKFEGCISLHDNIDSTVDSEIYNNYSTGYIPTLVLGCKYYRVGPGKSMEQEAKVLTALICDLTGNKPVDVCTAPEIVDLINKI